MDLAERVCCPPLDESFSAISGVAIEQPVRGEDPTIAGLRAEVGRYKDAFEACRTENDRIRLVASHTARGNLESYEQELRDKAESHAQQIVALTHNLSAVEAERDQYKKLARRLFTKGGQLRTNQLFDVVRGALRSMLHDHTEVVMTMEQQEMTAKRIVGQIESWMKE